MGGRVKGRREATWRALSMRSSANFSHLFRSGMLTPAKRTGKSACATTSRGLAAVEGGVADVAAGDEVDDVFGDVDGVVADALEIFGDEDELEGGEDDGGILHHVGEEFAEELVAEAVHLIVALHDAAGEFLIGADEGIEAIANHAFSELAHAREVHVGFYLGVAE